MTRKYEIKSAQKNQFKNELNIFVHHNISVTCVFAVVVLLYYVETDIYSTIGGTYNSGICELA